MTYYADTSWWLGYKCKNDVRHACAISDKHALNHVVRGMDLFHVAIALELGCDFFLSFDQEQIDLAKAAGIKVPKLTGRKS